MFLGLVLLLCLMSRDLCAQITTNNQAKILNKKNLVIAALVLQQVGSTAIEYDWWWKDSTNAFHFEKDGFWRNYSYGIDKFGHAYTSYLYFTAINESMRWAGFSDKSRRYTSIILH